MKAIKISILSILIMGSVFLVSDSMLYYYGKSSYNLFCYSMPMGLKPDFWDSYVRYPVIGFTISNELGGLVIAKGETIRNNSDKFVIDKIIRYGFNKTRVIAYIKDISGNNHYIECFKDKNPEILDIHVTVITGIDDLNQNDIKWIDIESKEKQTMEAFKDFSILFLIISLLFCVITIFLFVKKSRNSAGNSPNKASHK